MKVRLLSDLHLELCQNVNFDFKKEADVVILAGDIGNPFMDNYKLLLRKLSLSHQKVFVISGNHEYYSKKTMSKVDKKIRNICEKEDDIHFLQMDSYIFNDVKFMGCTLWSNPIDKTLCKYMNDFDNISTNDKTFSFDKYNEKHLLHKNWLENELSHNDNNKTIVITHHLPSFQLINEKFIDNPLNQFFASDIKLYNARISCYGHTHISNKMEINGIQYYCNPKGYSHEESGWNADFIFTI